MERNDDLETGSFTRLGLAAFRVLERLTVETDCEHRERRKNDADADRKEEREKQACDEIDSRLSESLAA